MLLALGKGVSGNPYGATTSPAAMLRSKSFDGNTTHTTVTMILPTVNSSYIVSASTSDNLLVRPVHSCRTRTAEEIVVDLITFLEVLGPAENLKRWVQRSELHATRMPSRNVVSFE